MAENLFIQGDTKEELYSNLYPQLEALLANEQDMIANMANVSACLMDTFHFWWVGFYRVVCNHSSEDEVLVLGPFQGPLACTRIKKGKGVCGTSWSTAQTVIVPDVDQFPGHIACSSASRSEIVVPLFQGNKVIAVLDIDSEKLNTFDETDALWLRKIADLFSK